MLENMCAHLRYALQNADPNHSPVIVTRGHWDEKRQNRGQKNAQSKGLFGAES